MTTPMMAHDTEQRGLLDERIAEAEEALHVAELGGRRYRAICLRTYLAQLKAERDGGLAHLVMMSLFTSPYRER